MDTSPQSLAFMLYGLSDDISTECLFWVQSMWVFATVPPLWVIRRQCDKGGHTVSGVALFMPNGSLPHLWCLKMAAWVLLWDHKPRVPREEKKNFV